MATTHSSRFRTDSHRPNARGVLLLAAEAFGVLATIAAATAAAYGLADLTAGLGGFVLVAAGWLAVVGASPEIGERLALRFDRVDVAARAPRPSRGATVLAALLGRHTPSGTGRRRLR